MKKHKLDFDSFFITDIHRLVDCLKGRRRIFVVIGKRLDWLHRRPAHPKLGITTGDRYHGPLRIVGIGLRTRKKRLPPYPHMHVVFGPDVVLQFPIFIGSIEKTCNVIYLALLAITQRLIAKPE